MSTFFWPFTAVRMLEITIFSLLITLMIYFPTEHYSVDPGQFHWIRLGHIAGLHLLLSLYLQSVGQFFGALLLNYPELAIIAGNGFYNLLFMTSGFLMVVEHMNIAFLYRVAQLAGVNYITKALFYAFYGIDRCRPETEYSSVLHENYVNPDTVYTDLRQVLFNIIFFRTLTLVVMVMRYSLPKIYQMSPSGAKQLISIDYPREDFEQSQPKPEMKIEISKISKLEPEVDEFNKFASEKIVIAWRRLTLFRTESPYESRSATTHSR